MKTIIKLLLIYLAIQLVTTMVVVIPLMIINHFDMDASVQTAAIWGSILSFFIMGGYLWRGNYFRKDERTWSVISPRVLVLTMLIGISSYVFLIQLNEILDLPNILEDQFVNMSNNLWGILAISLLGPVLEEFLFRGAILGTLLKKMNPRIAILVSAVIFGLIHFNPAQVVYAFFFGIVLGRIYYVTGSLILCMIVHVMANSISTWITVAFPEYDTLTELVGQYSFTWVMALSAGVLAFSMFFFRRLDIIPDWKEEPVGKVNSDMEIHEEIKE